MIESRRMLIFRCLSATLIRNINNKIGLKSEKALLKKLNLQKQNKTDKILNEQYK